MPDLSDIIKEQDPFLLIVCDIRRTYRETIRRTGSQPRLKIFMHPYVFEAIQLSPMSYNHVFRFHMEPEPVSIMGCQVCVTMSEPFYSIVEE